MSGLEVRYYQKLPKGAYIFQTPFTIERFAIKYAKAKLKRIIKNSKNWKLDRKFLQSQMKYIDLKRIK